MKRGSIVAAVRRGKILVSDGAWGTMLHKRGLQPGDCPERWCLERPKDVLEIAQGYIEAGADMVKTNSFGGTRIKLGYYGLADRAAEINETAARLSRQAAGEEHWVIASIGPTGKMLMLEEITEAELYEAFKEQAQALERGGADALCIETMMATDEAAIAIRAARENTRCEVICTFTFDRTVTGEYRTLMGTTPQEATRVALESGAHIIGTNCGNGFERMIDIVRLIRQEAPDAPLLVHANAGLPKNINGIDVFPDTPEQMAGLAPALIEAGANIIGGCCGTTPNHIREIRAAVNGFRR